MKGKQPSKADLKLIRSLSRKKSREESGLFVVEGEKCVEEALESGLRIHSLYYMDEIGEEMMGRMTLLSTPSPALALLFRRKKELEELSSASLDGVALALDGVRDPGNLGTIIRLADWFGIKRIFASKECVDQYNPKTVQASMGSVLRMDVEYRDLEEVLKAYMERSIPVYATALEGENIYGAGLERENALIVMGNESTGVSDGILNLIPHHLYIPPYPTLSMEKRSESLNVAIATAILCYEFRRR